MGKGRRLSGAVSRVYSSLRVFCGPVVPRGLKLPAEGSWLLDTMRAAKRILPGPSHKLAACLENIGVENEAAHTALADADATARLLSHLLPWMADELSHAEPLNFDDFDLAVLPPSIVPLLVRDDGLFADENREEHDAGDGGSKDGEGPQLADDWMRRITDAAPGIGDEAADEYMALLADAMVDDRLDDAEIAQLLDMAHQLELSDDDVAELHELYLRQVSIEAWADGVVTAEERERLLAIADELSIGRARVAVWLAEPLGSLTVVRREPGEPQRNREDAGAGGEKIVLAPGDRVTFTGAMAIPREEWARRAANVGLDVGGVTKRSRVVVAADVASRSGKARRARELGIPIVGEREFAKMLADISADLPVDVPADVTRDTIAAVLSDGIGDTSTGDSVLDLGRIFPWLADVPETRADVSGVVESWITHRADVPLHSMSPVLAPSTRPDGIDPSLKTTIAWFTEYPEPLVASAEDLRELRHVGRVKLRSFIYATVLQAIDDAELLDSDDDRVEDWPVAALYDEGVVDDGVEYFEGDFSSSSAIYSDDETSAKGPLDADEIVAGWVSLSGGWPSVDDPDMSGNPPALVREALEEAANPAERVFNRVLEEVAAVIGADDYRRSLILDGRVSGGKTLDELGRAIGVTRERVRQIESTLLTELRETAVASVLLHSAIAARFGPCSPIQRVLDVFPRLEERPTGLSSTILELLPAIVVDGKSSWRVEDGWLLVGDVDAGIAAALESCADDYGIVDIDAAALIAGMDRSVLGQRLRETTNVEFRGNLVFTRTGSIPDRAATELHLAERPLTTEELHQLLGNRSLTSISNALSASDHIVRCGRGTWALAEWGEEEWTTIFDLINRRIDESEDGYVALDDLNDDADRFGVSHRSILTYASTPEFVIEDRRVRRAGVDEKPTVRATPEETRALYRRDGKWSLLVTVTHDHLRGSGSQIPVGVAVHCGLEFGETIQIPSRLGDQRVSWGRSMTNIGTISRFMTDLGCVEGDRVWLIFGDEFDVVPATPRREGLAGTEELLNATGLDDVCGADDGVGAVLAVVNEAMDLPADAARRKTVSRLRHRRDEDLAELVRGL